MTTTHTPLPPRLALVTGGSRGLGAALCDQLIGDGWQVVELSRSAPHAYSVPIDLSDPDSAIRSLEARLPNLLNPAQPPLTALQSLLIINNAGTLDPIGPAAQQPAPALLANLHTNLCTPILVLARLVAHFQATACPKQLVNISSGAARTAYAGWSLYGAAKAGMEQFICCLAAEQARMPHPIVPINIYPGVIDTAMQAAIRASDETQFPARERFAQRHHSGALQPPARVAAAIRRIVARPDLQAGARYDVADHWPD